MNHTQRAIIQRTGTQVEACQPAEITPSWQKQLAQAIRDPQQLIERLRLPADFLAGAQVGHQLFPVRVPEAYLSRIQPQNPQDPLLLQVLPLAAEAQRQAGYLADPLNEKAFSHTPGLVQKYQTRALIITTGACAINCRYCFRRHFPYAAHRLSEQDRRAIIAELLAATQVNEVILSGGDPLMLTDSSLRHLVEAIAGVPHIQRLRIHTRLPVVIPDRISQSFTDWFAPLALQKVVVLHINHPQEIDAAVCAAIARLATTDATLLNQSVILKGINDDASILASLSERLFANRVLPYYLHAFDPVEGAAHFSVSDDELRRLSRELLTRLPGFLVPRAVREVAGQTSKWPLDLGLM